MARYYKPKQNPAALGFLIVALLTIAHQLWSPWEPVLVAIHAFVLCVLVAAYLLLIKGTYVAIDGKDIVYTSAYIQQGRFPVSSIRKIYEHSYYVPDGIIIGIGDESKRVTLSYAFYSRATLAQLLRDIYSMNNEALFDEHSVELRDNSKS